MASGSLQSRRVKPAVVELLTLRVLRSERISPHFQRVTLGQGDVARFRPMGFDQWIRLFIPVAEDSLARLPDRRLDTVAYLKFLTISKSSRPVLRNYTVRAYRPDGVDGPEIDVDFVVHGTAGTATAGPAATWAQTCTRGDEVAILDEGIMFNPDPSIGLVRLVAEESGLPAVAGILASLPAGLRAEVLVEVPSDADRQPLPQRDGIEVTWLSRADSDAVPGVAALAAARALAPATEPFHGLVVGEQALAAGLRRHWVGAGVPKANIVFCGYWKAGRSR